MKIGETDTYQDILVWNVSDISLVPGEYKKLVPAKIEQALQKGKRNIPGISVSVWREYKEAT